MSASGQLPCVAYPHAVRGPVELSTDKSKGFCISDDNNDSSDKNVNLS